MDYYNGKKEGSRRRIDAAVDRPNKYDGRMVNHTRPGQNYEMERRRDSRRKKTHGLSFWQCIVADVLAVAVFLLVFAYFHHVNPVFTKIDEPQSLPAPSVQDPVQDSTTVPEEGESDPQQSAEPAGDPAGDAASAAHKFEDKFSATPVHTDNQYINENVNVTVTTTEENGVTYHVADVYVRDVQYLKADFGTGAGFGMTKEHRALIQEAAQRVNAFVAINGDQCGQHSDGMVVRNGVLYRESPKNDVCVLNYDGTMVTYGEKEFDTEAIKQAGAWQVWTFGPELLDDNGQPLTEFNTTVAGANPRSVIGMIEPLHYLLVTVDGRGESAGLTMSDLAALMQKLGCTVAYNLDGGGTAAMAVNGEVYSTPSKVRSVYDIIYVAMED